MLEGGQFTVRKRPRWRRNRSQRGVSDVVATILLLALTVTLFSTIFFFVNTFPRPPPQSSDQFQANLVYSADGLNITGIQILHLAGPAVTGGALIYVRSAVHPLNYTAPLSIAAGLGGQTVWSLGQTWAINLAPVDHLPDNITISIVSQNSLLFQISLPGHTPNVPPFFTVEGTAPRIPGVGQGFEIFTVIQSANLNKNSVFVNVSLVPGAGSMFPAPQKMSSTSVPGEWVFSIPNGTTTESGQFFVFINATNKVGQQNAVVFVITIGGTSSVVTVVPVVNPSAPVRGSAVQLGATVSNTASSGGSLTVSFAVNGVAMGTATGTSAAGSTVTVFDTTLWTPANIGTATVTVDAAVASVGSAFGSVNLTVFPPILLFSHNYAEKGVLTAFNESALLSTELTADGIPFTVRGAACSQPLTAANFTGFTTAGDVVIIDFGSATPANCASFPSAAQESGVIEPLVNVDHDNLWVVGSNGFINGAAVACATYDPGYLPLFGIKGTGVTCATGIPAGGVTATYTPATGNGLFNFGVPSLTINKTVVGSSATWFEPYACFNQGALTAAQAWLTVGVCTGTVVGTWASGGNGRTVALATDPALLSTALTPGGNIWGAGAAGSAVTYNVMNFLCGLANTTTHTPNRALTDFGVGGIVVAGTFHTLPSTFYVYVRANGPIGGVVTVTLYVNGTVAFYQGSAVQATVSLSPYGALLASGTYVPLVWQASGKAGYFISAVLTTPSTDIFYPNNALAYSVINQPVVIN